MDPENEDPYKKIYWDVSIPEGESLWIAGRDVMSLITVIATATRMRTKEDVEFEMMHDGDEISLPRGSSQMKDILDVLSQRKPSKVAGEDVRE